MSQPSSSRGYKAKGVTRPRGSNGSGIDAIDAKANPAQHRMKPDERLPILRTRTSASSSRRGQLHCSSIARPLGTPQRSWTDTRIQIGLGLYNRKGRMWEHTIPYVRRTGPEGPTMDHGTCSATHMWRSWNRLTLRDLPPVWISTTIEVPILVMRCR